MKLSYKIRAVVRKWALALFTIPKCAVCRNPIKGRGAFLCRSCNLRFLTERAKSCSDCGYPHPECICTIEAASDVYRVLHMVPYDPNNYGVSSQAVFDAKDKFRSENFRFIADQLRLTLDYNGITPNDDWIITWVPRRKRTVRRIGHDQSKKIAGYLAESYEMKLTGVFANKGDKPQKMQNFGGRVRNAYSSYAVTLRGRYLIKGKTVVIVDDLVTTGATQHVVISLAMESGANDVIPLTFAKTDRGITKYRMRRNR